MVAQNHFQGNHMTGVYFATVKICMLLTAPLLPSVSKPRSLAKAGVSSNNSIICLLDCEGGFGCGPPPVFLLSFLL